MIEGQKNSTTASTTKSSAGPVTGGTQRINTLIPSATKGSGASQCIADYTRGASLLTPVMKIAWLTVSVIFV